MGPVTFVFEHGGKTYRGTFAAEEIEPRSKERGQPPRGAHIQPADDAAEVTASGSPKRGWRRAAIWLAILIGPPVLLLQYIDYREAKFRELADMAAPAKCKDLVAWSTGIPPDQECRLISFEYADSPGCLVYTFEIGPLPADGRILRVEFHVGSIGSDLDFHFTTITPVSTGAIDR